MHTARLRHRCLFCFFINIDLLIPFNKDIYAIIWEKISRQKACKIIEHADSLFHKINSNTMVTVAQVTHAITK